MPLKSDRRFEKFNFMVCIFACMKGTGAQHNTYIQQQLLRIPTGRRQTSWLLIILHMQPQEVEPGTTRITFKEWSERALNPGSPDLKASVLTTGPQCLLKGCHSGLIEPRSRIWTPRFRGPFLESPETLRAIFGCHNSLCISRTERI